MRLTYSEIYDVSPSRLITFLPQSSLYMLYALPLYYTIYACASHYLTHITHLRSLIYNDPFNNIILNPPLCSYIVESHISQ